MSTEEYIEKNTREILRFEPNGIIIWSIWEPYKRVIKVKDKDMLCLALMDLVYNFTDGVYDYSLLDKDLYDKYKKFLESK